MTTYATTPWRRHRHEPATQKTALRRLAACFERAVGQTVALRPAMTEADYHRKMAKPETVLGLVDESRKRVSEAVESFVGVGQYVGTVSTITRGRLRLRVTTLTADAAAIVALAREQLGPVVALDPIVEHVQAKLGPKPWGNRNCPECKGDPEYRYLGLEPSPDVFPGCKLCRAAAGASAMATGLSVTPAAASALAKARPTKSGTADSWEPESTTESIRFRELLEHQHDVGRYQADSTQLWCNRIVAAAGGVSSGPLFQAFVTFVNRVAGGGYFEKRWSQADVDLWLEAFCSMPIGPNVGDPPFSAASQATAISALRLRDGLAAANADGHIVGAGDVAVISYETAIGALLPERFTLPVFVRSDFKHGMVLAHVPIDCHRQMFDDVLQSLRCALDGHCGIDIVSNPTITRTARVLTGAILSAEKYQADGRRMSEAFAYVLDSLRLARGIDFRESGQLGRFISGTRYGSLRQYRWRDFGEYVGGIVQALSHKHFGHLFGNGDRDKPARPWCEATQRLVSAAHARARA